MKVVERCNSSLAPRLSLPYDRQPTKPLVLETSSRRRCPMMMRDQVC